LAINKSGYNPLVVEFEMNHQKVQGPVSGKRHVDISGVILKHLAVAVASVLPVIFRVLPKGKGATHKILEIPSPAG